MIYKFQCNRCFIISGHMSRDSNATPTCCDGEKTVAIKIKQDTEEKYNKDILFKF